MSTPESIHSQNFPPADVALAKARENRLKEIESIRRHVERNAPDFFKQIGYRLSSPDCVLPVRRELYDAKDPYIKIETVIENMPLVSLNIQQLEAAGYTVKLEPDHSGYRDRNGHRVDDNPVYLIVDVSSPSEGDSVSHQ